VTPFKRALKTAGGISDGNALSATVWVATIVC
jgi:hypothetical protein